MQKNFTHIYSSTFTKALTICTIVVCSSFSNKGLNNDLRYDLQVKTIKCYPNPATSYINFELPDDYISKGYQLQVYSFTGKKMYEANVISAKATLTFNNQFYRGIYVYQLQDKTGRVLETGKFQVNK